MVSARDFIYLSQTGYVGDEFIMGGKSVEFKDGPKTGKGFRPKKKTSYRVTLSLKVGGW